MAGGDQQKLQLIPVVLYASTSIVISMVYKTVLSSYNFSAPFFLLTVQTAVALAFTTFAQVRADTWHRACLARAQMAHFMHTFTLFVSLLRIASMASNHHSPLPHCPPPYAQMSLSGSKAFFVPQFDTATYKKYDVLPVAAYLLHPHPPCVAPPCRSILPGALFVVNIAVGFLGLRLVNVPMFLAVRRTTTVFVMLGEWAILSRVPSSLAMASVALIATGTVVAGSETFAAEFLGFMFTVGNNILTAGKRMACVSDQSETPFYAPLHPLCSGAEHLPEVQRRDGRERFWHGVL
jgi:hypothetical protein